MTLQTCSNFLNKTKSSCERHLCLISHWRIVTLNRICKTLEFVLKTMCFFTWARWYERRVSGLVLNVFQLTVVRNMQLNYMVFWLLDLGMFLLCVPQQATRQIARFRAKVRKKVCMYFKRRSSPRINSELAWGCTICCFILRAVCVPYSPDYASWPTLGVV